MGPLTQNLFEIFNDLDKEKTKLTEGFFDSLVKGDTPRSWISPAARKENIPPNLSIGMRHLSGTGKVKVGQTDLRDEKEELMDSQQLLEWLDETYYNLFNKADNEQADNEQADNEQADNEGVSSRRNSTGELSLAKKESVVVSPEPLKQESVLLTLSEENQEGDDESSPPLPDIPPPPLDILPPPRPSAALPPSVQPSSSPAIEAFLKTSEGQKFQAEALKMLGNEVEGWLNQAVHDLNVKVVEYFYGADYRNKRLDVLSAKRSEEEFRAQELESFYRETVTPFLEEKLSILNDRIAQNVVTLLYSKFPNRKKFVDQDFELVRSKFFDTSRAQSELSWASVFKNRKSAIMEDNFFYRKIGPRFEKDLQAEIVLDRPLDLKNPNDQGAIDQLVKKAIEKSKSSPDKLVKKAIEKSKSSPDKLVKKAIEESKSSPDKLRSEIVLDRPLDLKNPNDQGAIDQLVKKAIEESKNSPGKLRSLVPPLPDAPPPLPPGALPPSVEPSSTPPNRLQPSPPPSSSKEFPTEDPEKSWFKILFTGLLSRFRAQ